MYSLEWISENTSVFFSIATQIIDKYSRSRYLCNINVKTQQIIAVKDRKKKIKYIKLSIFPITRNRQNS